MDTLAVTAGANPEVRQTPDLTAIKARQQGAFTAEINLEETPASAAVDVAVHGGAEIILPCLA